MDSEPVKKRGFALLSPEKRRELARKGGASVPKAARSFSQDPALARAAGSKGGTSVHASKRSFSQDRQLAASAGRKGGMKEKQNRT